MARSLLQPCQSLIVHLSMPYFRTLTLTLTLALTLTLTLTRTLTLSQDLDTTTDEFICFIDLVSHGMSYTHPP